MRADRLLALIMLLQNRTCITAKELAEELEVSERTIYRDVIALSTAGVPVYTERGPGGGIRLVERYRSDLTGLSKDEVQALFMLSIPSAVSDLGFDQELKAALLKLGASLPTSLQADHEAVRKRVYIDPDPEENKQVNPSFPHLQTVQRATWEERSLEIRYSPILGDHVDPLKAVIEPYGLVFRGGFWYLVGKRSDHVAVIRVDHLLDANVLASACLRPEDFDLAAFWKQWRCEEAANRAVYTVVARATARVVGILERRLDQPITTENEDPSPSHDGLGNWMLIEIPFEFHDQARDLLLAMGGGIEVIEPPALRHSLRDYAEQIVRVYDDRTQE